MNKNSLRLLPIVSFRRYQLVACVNESIAIRFTQVQLNRQLDFLIDDMSSFSPNVPSAFRSRQPTALNVKARLFVHIPLAINPQKQSCLASFPV